MSNEKQKLSNEKIDELLELLANDDDFRERFSAAPEEALKQIGWTGDSPACMQVETLASKEQIAAARDQLGKQFMAQGAYNVIFNLDASKVGTDSKR